MAARRSVGYLSVDRGAEAEDLDALVSLVAGFVAAFRNEANPQLALVPLRQMDEHVFNRALNVCILHLAQAKFLGIEGQVLHDLGAVALLHDVGWQLGLCSEMTILSARFDTLRTAGTYGGPDELGRTAGALLERAGGELHPALTLHFLKLLRTLESARQARSGRLCPRIEPNRSPSLAWGEGPKGVGCEARSPLLLRQGAGPNLRAEHGRMRKLLPLRLSIPLSLALLALVLAGIQLVHDRLTAFRDLEASTLRRATSLSYVAAPGVERSLAEGDEARARGEVERLALVPQLALAAVLDADDRVRISTETGLTDLPLAATRTAPARALVARARATLAAQSEVSRDGASVRVAIPFHLPTLPGELHPSRVGILYTETDLTAAKAEVWAGIARRTLLTGGTACLACVLVWAFLRATFTRDLDELKAGVEAYASGSGELKVPSEGGHELARIGQVFTKLVGDLTTQHSALKESEERFERAFRSNPVAAAVVRAEGRRIVEANDALASLTGYGRQELLGRTARELGLASPEDLERCAALARSQGYYHNVELEGLRRDGERRTVLTSSEAVSIGGEEHFLLTFVDITERKAQEREIERLTRLYEALSQVNQTIVRSGSREELLADVCQVLTRFGKFRMAWIGWRDPQTEEVRPVARSGDDSGYLKGLVVSVADRPEGRGPTGTALREGRTYVCNDFFADPNTAPWRPRAQKAGFRASAAFPIRVGGDLAAALMVYATEPGFFGPKEVELLEETALDVSFGLDHLEAEARRARAEEERARMEKQFLDAQKMEAIGTLAGGIAHDFNNILTPILAHSELTLLQLPAGAPVCDDVSQVVQAARRAADLTRQILALSRRADDQLIPVSLTPLVKEVAKLIRASLPSTIEVRTILDPACGPVLGDPSRLHQVILNLCTNARDAMLEIGGVLTLCLERAPAGRVRLLVSDTGAGIPPEIVGRIFEPYFTTKVRGKGTGLGLATVRSIVTSLGGEVSARSEAGRGSTFEVLLSETQRAAAEPLESPDLPRGRGERVLVVDDEPSVVSVLERLLEVLGYRPSACCGSWEAFSAFAADPAGFDAVVTDYTMPGMTGLELAAHLLAVRPELPVLVGTGYAESLNEQTLQEAGVRGVVLKPYSLKVLAETLGAVFAPKGTAAG